MKHAKTLAALSLAALTLAGCRNSDNDDLPDDDVMPQRSQPVLDSAADWEQFGEPVAAQGAPTVAVSSVLADPAAYEGRDVELAGNVSEVCQSSGCWLKMTDPVAAAGSESVFVKFTCPSEGRLIPPEALGRPARVVGEVVVEEMSQDEARHMAEDAGKSPQEIEQIVGPQKSIRVMSPSARVSL